MYETMTQLELAQSLGYIDTFKDVEELASEVSRILDLTNKEIHSILELELQLELTLSNSN